MNSKRKWTPEQLIDFEAHIKELFEKGMVTCPIHLSGGNEVTLISLFEGIKDQDYVLSTHRNHYHYLLKGGNPHILLDEILGHSTGCCKGKGRSMHIYDPDINFYTSAIVGGICSIAVGIALGLKKGFKSIHKCPLVWCFIGDGAEDEGFFVEAARFGLSRGLPLTFVIEDNDLAVESTKKERWHNYHPVEGYNIIRYNYKRTYPHVGVGKHISF